MCGEVPGSELGSVTRYFVTYREIPRRNLGYDQVGSDRLCPETSVIIALFRSTVPTTAATTVVKLNKHNTDIATTRSLEPRLFVRVLAGRKVRKALCLSRDLFRN